jgi:putative hydrolase of the HAD superfamily
LFSLQDKTLSMIRNILFDFGGVIIDIDPPSVIYELMKMGVTNGLELHQHLSGHDAYVRLEKNAISPDEFRNLIRDFTGLPLTDDMIDHAWNTIIKDIPQARVDLIKRLRKDYGVYLLSNTNAIHYDYYNLYVKKYFGYDRLEDLFDRAWYSYQMGLFKPDPEIFLRVLSEGNLVAEETLFIDDNAANVAAAEKVGLKGYHLKEGEDVVEIFEDGVFNG